MIRRELGLLAFAVFSGTASCTGAELEHGAAGKGPVAGQGGRAGSDGQAGTAGRSGQGASAGTPTSGGSAGGIAALGGVSGSAAGAAGVPAVAGASAGGGAGKGAGAAGRAGNGASSGSVDQAGMAGGGDDAGAPGVGTLTSFELAVVGSSTAAGEGASSSSKGWVSLLASSLRMTMVGDFSASNLAVGGYTTSELLPDSGADGSIDDAIDRDPNLIIVALAGSNDLSAGTSTNTFLSRLEAMRDAANAAGIPVFFVSTAPKDLSTSEQQTLEDWAGEMRSQFSSCWAPGHDGAYSPCFIDIFELLANESLGVKSEYGAGDGIHLNDAGHEVIFEAARDVVEPYVCSLTACR